MRALKILAIVLLCAFASSGYCQERNTEDVIKGCCTLHARAYVNKTYHPEESSRFVLDIVHTQKDTYNWDFTLDGDLRYHYTNIYGGISPVPYGNDKQTTIHALFHQYDYYDELVTFKNLDVGLLPADAFGTPSSHTGSKIEVYSRYLSLTKPITLTTPSGISVTLPAQGEEDLKKRMMNFNGNPNALFIQVEISPNKSEVVLPKSPLYKEHGKPVSIKLGYPDQGLMNWHLADSKYKTFPINLPNLKTVTHLDSLTLIVRQRVELQALPIAIKVPIDR